VSDTLEVQRAGPEDVDEVVGILSEATGWLAARGISQWPDPFPRDRVAALAELAGDESAQLRHECVTDTRGFHRYARSGNEGGPATPPRREGVRLEAEGSTAMGAREWREYWRRRGMRELRLLLWAAWDPIGGTPPGQYDSYALRIASLLGRRASTSAVAAELGRIRRDELGLEAAPAADAATAEKIAAWFERTSA
jgi:hypothetical protein